MRSSVRTLLALAPGCLLALPVATPLARESGRDYPRCVQGCNSTRGACEDRCTNECADLYPTSATQRRACENACHGICVDQEQECKGICRNIKNGGTPEEP